MSEQQPRPKILIVDDRSENLLAMNMLLKPLQVDVVQAQSGKRHWPMFYDTGLLLCSSMCRCRVWMALKPLS